LPALVLLKQLWDGSGQGLLAKNAAGNTIRLSLNLWYHYYGNRMGYGKGRTAALLPESRLTPVTAGISRPAARTLTYGSNESVRVKKLVQLYGMHNALADSPLFSFGGGNMLQNRAFVSMPRVAGAIPGQVWNKKQLLNLPSESALPSPFFQRKSDQVDMPATFASFPALRMGTKHVATIINDRLPGAAPDMAGGDRISKHFVHEPGFRSAESQRSFLTDRYDGRAPLPMIRLAPVIVDISRPVVDVLADTKHEIGRVEKTLRPHRMRNVSTGSHPTSQEGRDTAFASLPMTASPELGALPDQAWGKGPLPGLTSGTARFSPRFHRQSEQIAMPVMQTPQQLFRKGVRQSRMTTNDNAHNAVSSMVGQTSPHFLKSQDVHVSHMGSTGQMNALDAAHHSTEAENSPVSGRSGSYERAQRSVDKAVLGPAGSLHHLLQSNKVYGGVSLPAIRLIPVTTGMSGPIAENWTSTTGGDGKDDVAVQVYGRRNIRAGDALFTREGVDLLQSKQLPTSLPTSIPSSGKTWDETSPLVHKRAGHIPGTSEKSPSSSTARTNNSSASHRPALVVDETITSGVYREGTGDGISVSEDFTDTKGLAATGRQAAIPAAELKRVADSVYKMVEKRIMIERERRGM